MVNRRQTLATLVAGTASALAAPAFAAPSKDEKRAEIRKMSKETLSKLYSLQPAAKKAIESSAGYAVFSNFGMKILVPAAAPETASQSTARRRPKPS